MNLITAVYILNATLLLLHEMESAYEKEWEILKLPGHITGFLLIHVPVIPLLFFGLMELENGSTVGLLFGFVLGICGLLPFLVHELFVRREGKFSLVISKAIIYGGVLSGAALTYLSVRLLV